MPVMADPREEDLRRFLGSSLGRRYRWWCGRVSTLTKSTLYDSPFSGQTIQRYRRRWLGIKRHIFDWCKTQQIPPVRILEAVYSSQTWTKFKLLRWQTWEEQTQEGIQHKQERQADYHQRVIKPKRSTPEGKTQRALQARLLRARRKAS